MAIIPAAGTVPWRIRDGSLEVALVHRARYRDWSWPKGKLDPGEEWPVAAVRETAEETGLAVTLGRPLPPAKYTVLERNGEPGEKEVRYWVGDVTGVAGPLHEDVDVMTWLPTAEAFDRLDYARDRDQLLAVVRAQQGRVLQTWPIVIVRHAKAVGRGQYHGKDDRRRPLNTVGRYQANALRAVFAAYGIDRVITSPSARCTETVRPYAAQRGLAMKLKTGLGEEGFADDPTKAPRIMAKVLRRGRPTVVCSHGPVIPTLLEALVNSIDGGGPGAVPPDDDVLRGRTELTDLQDLGMGKGHLVVAHMVGTGPLARVVATEQHPR